MENLKHTIVAGLAVTMIASLATMQGVNIKSVLADKVNDQPASTVSQYVQDDNLANVDSTLSVSNNDDAAAASDAKPADIAVSDVGYVILSEGTLNVRESASTESEVIGKLNCGDKVTILETTGDWYKVSYGTEGKSGYVSRLSITSSEEDAKAAALASFMYETGVAVVSEGALNIRSGAGTEYEVINQLDNGDKVIILEKGTEWFKVYFGRNYEVGYVNASSVEITGMVSRDEVAQAKVDSVAKSASSKGKISISNGAVNVRSTASENGEVITQLYNKDDVLILSSNGGWTKIAFGSSNTIGYVKSEYIVDESVSSRSSETARTATSGTSNVSSNTSKTASTTKKSSSSSSKSTSSAKSAKSETSSEKTSTASYNSSKGQALVAQAEKYLGTPYVYGGSSPSGFDCSGLVQYACRQVGISVGRSSRDQFNNGVAVSKSDLQPGDLVFFQRNGTISHVGIYVGNGQMIHSPQTGKTVTYTSITSASREKSYAGARRVTG